MSLVMFGWQNEMNGQLILMMFDVNHSTLFSMENIVWQPLDSGFNFLIQLQIEVVFPFCQGNEIEV